MCCVSTGIKEGNLIEGSVINSVVNLVMYYPYIFQCIIPADQQVWSFLSVKNSICTPADQQYQDVSEGISVAHKYCTKL